MDALQLWGGVECTVNRIGNMFSDQLQLTGHHEQLDDLDALAALGITTLRYPVLWERTSPDDPEICDWRWTDLRLGRLDALGVNVVAGLVHHGSGPKYIDLLSDDFARGLARHAGKVARRYPHLTDWTPVNEPVTTARFSALYGHWYPHRRDEESFWRAVLNQIDGVRLSMHEIRRVNPAARLVQTDDLGLTTATVKLERVAAFYNSRRWVGWDLLCGRLTPDHELWETIAQFGLEDRLHAIADDPCVPDLIGVNHYLTSDRFLDNRCDRYPGRVHHVSGNDRFVDLEAVRVIEPAADSLTSALREAWARYGIPIAVTEVHNHCTREEQLRWMAEAWDSALALRDDGIPIEAVTCWALLGSSGWNTLLTAPGEFETGALCRGSGSLRPTALATLLRGLAIDAPRHPVLAGQGWWHRPIRLQHAPVPIWSNQHKRSVGPIAHELARPLLICGATGTLGQAFAHACAHRDIAFVLMGRSGLDLTDEAQIDAALETHRPWAVINATGWVRVDDAEENVEACFSANATGAIALARACDSRGIGTASFSSDLVFDGLAGRAYTEADLPSPLNAYGRSKAAAEAALIELGGAHLVVRTAAFFSPYDDHNFAIAAIRTLGEGRQFRAADDSFMSPTYVPHLTSAVLDLLIDAAQGIWHLTNGTAVSWAEFARTVARACGLDEGLVIGVPAAEMAWAARRPAYVPLATKRGRGLPPLEQALDAFATEAERFRSSWNVAA